MKSSSTTKVVGALIVGAAAGAALGVLFAPKKGSETRQDIAEKAKKATKNLKDKFQGQVDELKSQVSKAERFLEDNVNGLKSEAESRLADAKNTMEHKINNAADRAKV